MIAAMLLVLVVFAAGPTRPGAWWVLVKYDQRSNEQRSAPVAIGPYPSAEFCRLAAHKLMPDERQFWTPQEREAQDKLDAEAAAKWKATLAALPRGKCSTVDANTRSERQVCLNGRGEIVSESGAGLILMGESRIPPVAITGCEFIPRSR